MSKCYEVTVTICTIVFVRGANSEDEAIRFAKDEISGIHANVECAAKKLTNESDIEASRRHADLRSEVS